jgi:hypothetical protein
MRSPRTPGTGITGVATKSLGGDELHPTEAVPETQRRYTMALRLDREADAALFLGRHDVAERLADRVLRDRA